MKGSGPGVEKTKVVVRRLPPSLSQAALMDHIDAIFAGRYSWVSFRPGKPVLGQKNQVYSRAYIDFKRAEDVIEFAEFFNGHIFVNEKGTQYKAIVEYAPSQRVPKHRSKKYGREGTIHRDPEYVEFLEFISKPVENLPSAEIQLERREAEKSAIPKDAPIITPLMDFVRQKRAAKSGSRRILSNNGKLNRRAGTSGIPGSSLSKRGSEKKRTSTTMYVTREMEKATGGKDKSAYALVRKRDDHQLSDKAVKSGSTSGIENLDGEKGIAGITESGKKKILLLKGTEKEVSSTQHHEPIGRITRSILLNKDARHNKTSGVYVEHQSQNSNMEKERRPPRPPRVSKETTGISDDKIAANDLHGFQSDKQEKRTRNQATIGDAKVDMPAMRSGEVKILGSGRGSHSSLDNGAHKPFGRRGPAHILRDSDGPAAEGKPPKRGSNSSYEKQVWVQKTSSGS